VEVESAIRAAERPEDCGRREIKLNTLSRIKKKLLDYVIRQFQLICGEPQGWIFVETPFSAIPQIPDSTEVRPLFKAPGEEVSSFRADLGHQPQVKRRLYWRIGR
jgi:hypothetical protein